tara:strand:+ start:203 stop:3118 length:2916 start_codon:yes stop_codon:yes gene_type:complete
MSIQIKLKNSVVQDSTPSTSDLPAVGEIALNANINSIGGFMRASDNSIVKIFGPGSLSTPTATTTVSGISELATNSETTTGTATNRVVTPAGLNAVTVAERTTSNNNYLAKAGDTLTGVLAATAGSNSAPAIHFGDSDSGIFGGTNTVSLSAGGTTRLTADTGVSVVGTLAVTGAITSTGDLTIAEKIIHSGDTDTFFSFPADNIAAIDTAGSERLRVDGSGRLLIGITTPRSPADTTPQLQVEGTNAPSSSLSLTRNSASTGGPKLILNKTRGTAVGADTVVVSGDTLGSIIWAGNDGTDSDNLAAEIRTTVDGTPGSNDMPGRLTFRTTADGANTTTERMRIDSAGRVGINETSLSSFNSIGDDLVISQASGSAGITIRSGTTNTGVLAFNDGANTNFRGDLRYDHNGDYMRLSTNGAERLRIDSSGQVGIGTTPSVNLHVKDTANVEIRLDDSGQSYGNIIYNNGSNSDDALIIGVDGGNTQNNSHIRFYVDNSEKARVDSSGLDVTGGITASNTGNASLILDAGTGGASGDQLSFVDFKINGTLKGNIAIHEGVSGTPLELNSAGGTGPVKLYNSGSEKLATTSDGIHITGRLGVGTSSPDTTAHIFKASAGTVNSDSNSVLTLENNTHCILQMLAPAANSARIMFGDPDDNNVGEINYDHNINSLLIKTNGSEQVRLNSSGNCGFGSSSPTAKVHANSATNTATFLAEGDVSNPDYPAYGFAGQNHNNGERGTGMYLAGDGQLAFATVATERLRIDASGNYDFNNGALMASYADDSNIDAIHHIDGENCWVFNSDTTLKASTGTSTLRCAAVDFGDSNNAADKLDEYEEGSWTPTLKFGGGTTGITYSTIRGGTYTKIGRQVTLNFGIKLSSKGSSTGHAEIHGIPFAAADLITGTTVENNGVCAFWDNVDPNLYAMFFHTNGSHIEIKVVHDGTDAVDKIVDAENNLIFQNDTSFRGSVTYFTAT